MTLVTYPLNNVDYVAEDAELFHCTRTSGIYSGADFSCTITGADNSMTIGTGIAWIRNGSFAGKVVAMKAAEIIDLGVPDTTHPRIDAVVLQFSANKNQTDVVVKQGVAASNPVAPSVIRTEAVYELHLYQVRRGAGATAITAADITDVRLSSEYCGLMADSVSRINLDTINAQASALIAQLRSEIEGVKDGSAYLLRSGGTMENNLSMGGFKITDLATPTNSKDAVNKEYADMKQEAITVKSATNKSKNLSKGTVTAITSLSVAAGTYLVCANATFPAYSSLEAAKYTHMLCVNTSTSFDHGKATAIGNVDGMQVDLNVCTVLTLTAAGTIYMLGYAAAASTVTNGNLYAIKIG